MGVFFSAALSVGLPRLAVSQHPALWSPDFPHARLLAPAVAWPTSQARFYHQDEGGVNHPVFARGHKTHNCYNNSVANAAALRRAHPKGRPLSLLEGILTVNCRPDNVAVNGAEGSIFSPATGRVIELSQVKDPVFSSGMLGEGLAVEPEDDVAYSPVSGTVEAVVSSKHAVSIKADSGAEVLLHVGVDTVNLRGRGFHLYAGKGERVCAGEPLISFDDGLIRKSGLDDTVIVTVTNPEEFGGVGRACGSTVRAGEALLVPGSAS